ncbi:MAG TPA: sugar ABC transporter permease [Actinopolymorphaceae bacterium]
MTEQVIARATGSTVSNRDERRRRRRNLRPYLLFVLFVGPNFTLLGVFTYWPLVYQLYLSLTDWDMLSPAKEFVGLANYITMLTDPRFLGVLGNTVYFAFGVVGGSVVLGLGLAMLLNQKLRGRNLVRTAVFAPVVLSGAAVALLWAYIFDPNYGLLRPVLSAVGLSSPDWINDPDWAMPAVIIVYLWKHIGLNTVIFLAGLQSLPAELYDAAKVDGAGPFRCFWRLTLPLLSPVTFFVLITTVIFSFQAFDIVAVLTAGGPASATTTLAWYVYQEGFVTFRTGFAAAGATMLFVALLLATLMQVRYVGRRVHYR